MNHINHDVVDFIQAFCQCTHPVNGTSSILLTSHQQKILNEIVEHDYTLHAKTRQCGGTLLLALYALYFGAYNNDSNILIILPKYDQTVTYTHLIQMNVKLLERFSNLQMQINNKREITFNTGSSIQFVSANSQYDAILKKSSYDLVICDEFAFFNEYVQTYLLDVLLHRSAKTIIQSSLHVDPVPFNKACVRHLITEGYKVITTKWTDVPHLTPEWEQNSRSFMSDERFNAEFMDGDYDLQAAQRIISTLIGSKE